MPLNRSDFQILAAERLEDARALFSAGRYAGAYYLAGYAVECALKACIAKKTNAGDFPPSPETVKGSYYKHDLKVLLKTAELDAVQKREAVIRPDFGIFWLTVTGWNEEWRYASLISENQAGDIIKAIEDPTNGVLSWLQTHW